MVASKLHACRTNSGSVNSTENAKGEVVIYTLPYRSKIAGTPVTVDLGKTYSTGLDAAGDYGYDIQVWLTGDRDTEGTVSVSKTPSALIITPVGSTVDFDVTIKPYLEATVGTQVPLSQMFTADDVYIQAARDIKGDVSQLLDFERYACINRAVNAVMGQFYGLVAQDYRSSDEVTPVPVGAGYSIDLSVIPIMRVGNTVKLTLGIANAANGQADMVSEDEFLAWRPANSRNTSMACACFQGNDLAFRLGSSVLTAGTVTLHYPRMPIVVTADTDHIDVPDGPLCELVIARLTIILARRLEMQVPDMQPQIERIVASLATMYKLNLTTEEMKAKVQALNG
jgi:hypothetical protein